MNKYRTALLLSAVLFLSGMSSSCFAKEVKPYVPPTTAVYVDTMAVAAISLPPAPADGSPEDKRDFAIMHQWQDKRTEAECSRAIKEAASGYDTFFGEMSPFPKPLPEEVAAFFKRVRVDVGFSTYTFKKKNVRLRPFLRDTTLKPCLPLEDGYAYPSGHTTLARVFALVLADLVPAKKADYISRADVIALDRVLGGVHHPTDTDAGKLLGDALHELQLKSPAYQADLELVRRYLVKEPAAAGAN